MTNNHEISLQTAVDMTRRYRANKPVNFPQCETFAVDAIRRLVATPGCASLRIYYGMKSDNEVDAILVAANEAGEDILPNLALSETDEPVILEDSLRCPDHCPPVSPLNTD
jgi:predicted transglutaminase-like cysteine proteinase